MGPGVPRAWQCPAAELTQLGVRLQETPPLLPWVPQPAVFLSVCPGVLGIPSGVWGGGALSLFPVLVAFALGRREWHQLPSPSWDSREGAQAAWVPAVAGGSGVPSAGASVTQGGRRCQSLPSPVGVCGVCWRPGTTGRNRFGQLGEALSRSAGVETGTTDARVPLAHPAPWSWWWQVTGTGACSRGVPGWTPRGHLTVGVSPAGGHSWVWGRMGGFTLQAGWPGSAHLLAVPQWGRRGWLGFRALVWRCLCGMTDVWLYAEGLESPCFRG